MPDTLKPPGGRRVVWLVAAAVAVAIGLAGTAYVSLGGKSWAIMVCQGEARQDCKGTEHWINCETNPLTWARAVRPDACINISVKKVAEAPGGKCGFATLEIKCSSR